jgi:dipeptidase D
MPLYDNELALYIIKIAKEKFNKDIKMSAIHAGLEVGEICKNNPNIIGVSIGPNIINPHSPREAVELKSVDFIYNLVLESIKNLK